MKSNKLSLKLGRSLNLINDGPNTPVDQMVKTPLEAPKAPPQFYSQPVYNESDDILADSEDGRRLQFSINFTFQFDQLLMSVYQDVLAKPTTTPFLGKVPPSGLVSRVSEQTMHGLIQSFGGNGVGIGGPGGVVGNPPCYDQQQMINKEFLAEDRLRAVLMQLIRKRLIELCTNQNREFTTIGYEDGGRRHSSIGCLSLTEANIASCAGGQRSASSSLSLRKQSLTRHNSCSLNNPCGGNCSWLHVGNINGVRGPGGGSVGSSPQYDQNSLGAANRSTDSSATVPDFVSPSFISRSAGSQTGSAGTSNGGFNSMMMEYQNYQTPPDSTKSSTSTEWTPPNSYHIVHNNSDPPGVGTEGDYFTGRIVRSNSSANSDNNFSLPLSVNTDHANYQALASINGEPYFETLDSPFMSNTTQNDESGLLHSSLPVLSMKNRSPIENAERKDSLGSHFSLSEKKRESLRLKRGIH